VTGPPAQPHLLVLYRSSDRADAALRAICEQGSRVTVVALARQEPNKRGCCDTRSVLWNGLCRDMAHEELSRALVAIDDPARVAFHVLVALDGEVVDAVTSEAAARGADEIVLADPRASGLGRLERRRLLRRSAERGGP
jgi:hypothetical protein